MEALVLLLLSPAVERKDGGVVMLALDCVGCERYVICHC